MKRRFSRIFKIFITFVAVFGLVTPTTFSSAHRIHHNSHVRASRQYYKTKKNRPKGRHNNRDGIIRLRRKKHAKQPRRLTSWQIKQNLNELDWQTMRDINRDRHHNHISALRLNQKLSQIGNFRSHQLQKYFSHNTPTRNNEAKYLINKKRIKSTFYGENIAASPLGTISVLDVGSYTDPSDTNSQNYTYRSKNGYQLANNINNASMYHDAGDNNGHRDNILRPQYRQVGIGSSYDSHDQNYYMAVEFIG